MTSNRYQPYSTPEERRAARAFRQIERLGITDLNLLGWFQRADFKSEAGCGTVTLDALDKLCQIKNLPRIGDQLRSHRVLRPAARRPQQTWTELARERQAQTQQTQT